MSNFRKISLFLIAILFFGLGAFFISIFIPQDAIAQSDDGNPQSTPGITRSEQSSSEPDHSTVNTNSDWNSSAEFPNGTTTEVQNLAGLDSVSEPAVGDAVTSLISWRIAGSALKPRENDVSYSTSGSGGCTYVSSGDAFTVWNTPIDLPQGSTIDTLRMYFYDTSTSNTSAWFTIYDLYGNIVQEWSVSSNTGGGYSFNDSAQINHTIDYSTYSYLINWRPVVSGSTLQLCGFRIFYEPPPFGLNFIPLVER